MVAIVAIKTARGDVLTLKNTLNFTQTLTNVNEHADKKIKKGLHYCLGEPRVLVGQGHLEGLAHNIAVQDLQMASISTVLQEGLQGYAPGTHSKQRDCGPHQAVEANCVHSKQATREDS